MTFVVPAVLGGLALMVMALVSRAAQKQKRKLATAAPAQIISGAILVHDINDDRCTGCDACVAVCPTNVLDLVSNKSRVLRFQDCIQCEACMWACPTEALVMHKEDAPPPPLRVPELDQNYQTVVPGQYLVGEVAGKPLVKNAANLGRAVVHHMLSTGLEPGQAKYLVTSDIPSARCFDVAIVGSGPGGLSAALTCIERGLSYVVLEKEQIIASTVSRYPKGKLVMAEPYETRNLSMLPVFDSSKEELVPMWEHLIELVGLRIQRGEAVEEVVKGDRGEFNIRTTVSRYRALRVVLATGTRGKPRTLGIPGENLPKVQSLLEDPDLYSGQAVLVVGGGDSALEAVLALASAGARVLLSYRGRSFSRAQPKLRSQVEGYEQKRRIKIQFQSQVVEFTEDTVTLQMLDGALKKYPNDAGFILIGSEPPIRWLEKLHVRFIERPHQFTMPASDEMVLRYAPDALDCPETAEGAAQVVTGEAIAEHQSGTKNRRWLRSATSLFHTKLEQTGLTNVGRSGRRHKGRGRRDGLGAEERTRILRMLRDEGGRLADEDSQLTSFPMPGNTGLIPLQAIYEEHEASPLSGAPAHLDTYDAKPAVIEGLDRISAKGPRAARKRPSQAPASVGGPRQPRLDTRDFLNDLIAQSRAPQPRTENISASPKARNSDFDSIDAKTVLTPPPERLSRLPAPPESSESSFESSDRTDPNILAAQIDENVHISDETDATRVAPANLASLLGSATPQGSKSKSRQNSEVDMSDVDWDLD